MMGRTGRLYVIAQPRPIASPVMEYLEALLQYSQFKAKYMFEDIGRMSRCEFKQWRRIYIALYAAVQKSRAAIKTAS